MKIRLNTMIISILIVLNLALLFKIYRTQAVYDQIGERYGVLDVGIQQYRRYIQEIVRSIPISSQDIIDEIQVNQQQVLKKDSIIVVMIPADVCMSCVSSLFSDLSNLKVPNDKLFLLCEVPNEKLKREWIAYNFKNYNVKISRVFLKHKFDSKILLAQVTGERKCVSFFHYEPEYGEFLNVFLGY